MKEEDIFKIISEFQRVLIKDAKYWLNEAISYALSGDYSSRESCIDEINKDLAEITALRNFGFRLEEILRDKNKNE